KQGRREFGLAAEAFADVPDLALARLDGRDAGMNAGRGPVGTGDRVHLAAGADDHPCRALAIGPLPELVQGERFKFLGSQAFLHHGAYLPRSGRGGGSVAPAGKACRKRAAAASPDRRRTRPDAPSAAAEGPPHPTSGLAKPATSFTRST